MSTRERIAQVLLTVVGGALVLAWTCRHPGERLTPSSVDAIRGLVHEIRIHEAGR